MLWIVIGCIFAGAVHDYFCGMLSIRNGGATMPNLAGNSWVVQSSYSST
ncbi:Carbon starvation protein, predicted membrane protein [Mannheimia haemolytica]|uniref:Carbon starvation protein, predicted membrane protein n=1 Tax=Mannheimia haemolytica TaxID=75985 RepID=A0A378N8Q6_MANHA|nr:Carbon starvation protein, predicted membrane protein [Mannheimia haemolytica]